MSVTIKDQVTAAERELRMRRSVYAKRVAAGSMKAEQADHEIACMDAIVKTLTWIADNADSVRRAHAERMAETERALREAVEQYA